MSATNDWSDNNWCTGIDLGGSGDFTIVGNTFNGTSIGVTLTDWVLCPILNDYINQKICSLLCRKRKCVNRRKEENKQCAP